MLKPFGILPRTIIPPPGPPKPPPPPPRLRSWEGLKDRCCLGPRRLLRRSRSLHRRAKRVRCPSPGFETHGLPPQLTHCCCLTVLVGVKPGSVRRPLSRMDSPDSAPLPV